jgi:hypothetical protein
MPASLSPRAAEAVYCGTDYEHVAAGQTDQVLGPTGGVNDYLGGLLVIPAATNCGAVDIQDGAGSAINVFPGGGGTALLSLIPFFVPICARSAAGAWSVTTGANVSVIATGFFT